MRASLPGVGKGGQGGVGLGGQGQAQGKRGGGFLHALR